MKRRKRFRGFGIHQRKRLTNEQEGRAFFIRHPRTVPPLLSGETFICTGAFDHYSLTIEEIFDVYRCDYNHLIFVVLGKRRPLTSEERALYTEPEGEDTNDA